MRRIGERRKFMVAATWPKSPPASPALQDGGPGAQYKMILHCRGAPASLFHPNGMAGDLHKYPTNWRLTFYTYY